MESNVKEKISSWRKIVGLDFIKCPDKDPLKFALELSSSTIKNLPLEDIDEILLALSNYHIYLHSELCTIAARLLYLEDELNMLVAPVTSKLKGGHAMERRAIAICNSDKMLALNKQLLVEKAKFEMLKPVCETIRTKIFSLNKIYERRMKELTRA